MGKLFFAVPLLVFLLQSAHAFESFVISDIRVEGLQRMSAGTVFNYLPIKIGEQMDQARSAEGIRALFSTGFFQDVRLEREADVLVVFVRERPAIASIKITGNKDFDTDVLLDSLKQIGLAEGRVFDRSMLDKVEQELRGQYFSNGKYGVEIDVTESALERNRVAIDIKVSEGKVARIKQINIVGNEVYDDEELLELFELSTPTFFSFFTGRDQYSKQKLAADLETMRSWYQDRGYLNFSIESTQVTITPSKRDIYITLNLKEGAQYRIKEIKLAGDLVVEPEVLFPFVQLNPGDLFSRKKIAVSVEQIGKRLSNEGYAFANINTIPEIDEEQKKVALTFFVDPGRRVYVRRVNMVGNTRTRDEVLRREMRQMEGGWFQGDQVERSRTRLQRLGYFDDVNVETPAVPGSTDQVDINYSVNERPSGNLLLGVGYSQSSGFLVNASVTQDNFLGSGKRVSVAFNNSDVNTLYSFSYLNPYYTIDGVSRGFGLFFRETDAGEANVTDFTTDAWGGDVSFGVPINEYDFVRASLEYQKLDIKTTVFAPKEITDFTTANGNQFDILTLGASWSHDTRNRAIFANRGSLQQVSGQVTVPGMELEYYKLNYRHLSFFPLARKLTLSLEGNLGYGEGYGDSGSLPFFENYYAGGVRSVRGYEDNTLGPRDTNGNSLGGAFRTVGNAELIFPVPFFPESRSFRMSAFFDIGNVFRDFDDFEGDELRYSTGISAIWMSPLGALSFSLAKPLNDKTNDETQAFQFTLGTLF